MQAHLTNHLERGEINSQQIKEMEAIYLTLLSDYASLPEDQKKKVDSQLDEIENYFEKVMR